MSALDDTFAILVRAAILGERCPQNAPHGPLKPGHTTDLARDGKIRIEVFRHNWRVVTILVGPNAGKQTRACPAGGKPYMTVDHRSTTLTRKDSARPGLSAPRLIAPHGLRDLKERGR